MTPEGARWALDVWVPALRSGNYKQGTGALYRTRSRGAEYCCLGVACDLLPEMVKWVPTVTAFKATSSGEKHGLVSSLPHDVADFLGLTKMGYAFGLPRALAQMNDDGFSFPEIADAIEKHALEVLAA